MPRATTVALAAALALQLAGAQTVVTTVAGTNGQGYEGDGGDATSARLFDPRSVATVGGDMLIADFGNNRVRRVAGDTGVITTVVGTGGYGFPNPDDPYGPPSIGDGGPANLAAVAQPLALTVDVVGNLFIVESSHRVRRVDAGTGVITTVAGTG